MTPILGISDNRRLPRLGKIRLGIKGVSKNTGGEYPIATQYFVCPPEVQSVYGEKPTRLDIIIPVEDDELWASQYYRQYSRSRGLVCKGDGLTCRRMIDTDTGAIAGRETQTVKWEEGGTCAGRGCVDYQSKACQEVMNLQVLLPKVPGLGIWQIDTGSINSIRNINDCATMVRAICGRVSWIPLALTLEPTIVNNPDDGKKKTVYCMHLRQEKGLLEIIEASNRPKAQLFISAPADDEAPGDKMLSAGTPENLEELESKVEDDIDTLFPRGQVETAKLPVQQVSSPSVPHQGPATPAPTKVEPKTTGPVQSQSDHDFEGVGRENQVAPIPERPVPPGINSPESPISLQGLKELLMKYKVSTQQAVGYLAVGTLADATDFKAAWKTICQKHPPAQKKEA